MLRAFDTLLQTTVSANAAAANSDNEAFRYECLCCGEEVFLAVRIVYTKQLILDTEAAITIRIVNYISDSTA